MGRRDPRRRDREAARRRWTTACRSSTTSPAPRSSSTSRTSRCSARRSACAGRRARSPPGCRTSAPTSASIRRRFEPFELPSIAVIGTGKRVGKTAVTTHLARLLARDRDVVVVAMGRGGPPEPEVIETPPHGRRARRAVALRAATPRPTTSRSRRSPACRRSAAVARAAVSPARSSSRTLPAGAAIAAERRPDVVIFDGSGAAIPPIDVDRRVLVVGAATRADAYLNTYRRLISDVVRRRALDACAPAARRGPLEGRVAVFTAGATDVCASRRGRRARLDQPREP